MYTNKMMALFTLIFLIAAGTIMASQPSNALQTKTGGASLGKVTAAHAVAVHIKQKQDNDAAANAVILCTNPIMHAQERTIYKAVMSYLADVKADNSVVMPRELARIVASYLPLFRTWEKIELSHDSSGKCIFHLARLNEHTVVSGSTSLIMHDLHHTVSHPLQSGGGSTTALVVLPCGDWVSAQFGNPIFFQWNKATGKQRGARRNVDCPGITCAQLLSDGTVAIGDWAGYATVWDVNAGKKIGKKSPFDAGAASKCMVALGDKLAISYWSGYQNAKNITLWNLADNSFWNLEGHSSAVCSLARLPNNDLISGDEGGNIIIWDTVRCTIRQKIERACVLPDPVKELMILPDGTLAIRFEKDCSIYLWDIAQGKTKHILEGHSLAVHKLAALGENELVSGGCGEIIIWDTHTGALKHRLKNADENAFQAGVISLQVMAENSIVAGCTTGTVNHWRQIPCAACEESV